MQHDDNWQPGGGRSRLLVPVLIVTIVAIFVLLHLTGVFGPGS
jgi:hypothetical protein